MYYLILATVIFLLAICTRRAWLSGTQPSILDIQSRIKKASQLVALNNWKVAAQEIESLKEESSQGSTIDASIKSDISLLYARVLRGQGDLDEALTFIQKELIQYPETLALYREQGKVQLELGYFLEALRSFQKSELLLRGEEDVLDLATAYFQLGQIKYTWDLLAEWIEDSCNVALLSLAGDCYWQAKTYSQAVVFYQRALKSGGSSHQLLTRLGHCLGCLGRIHEAEQVFREILACDPADISTALSLGVSLEINGFYEKAMSVYQQKEIWALGDGQILRQAGICAVHMQQYRYGELYLQEALQRLGTSAQLLTYLGYCLECQNKWDVAEKIYLQLVEEYPDVSTGYRVLAWLYGVGLSTTLTPEKGLAMASATIELSADPVSWEILSACEARAGNFSQAHAIQESLSARSHDKPTRVRRYRAMRALRKKLPLNEHHLSRQLVA